MPHAKLLRTVWGPEYGNELEYLAHIRKTGSNEDRGRPSESDVPPHGVAPWLSIQRVRVANQYFCRLQGSYQQGQACAFYVVIAIRTIPLRSTALDQFSDRLYAETMAKMPGLRAQLNCFNCRGNRECAKPSMIPSRGLFPPLQFCRPRHPVSILRVVPRFVPLLGAALASVVLRFITIGFGKVSPHALAPIGGCPGIRDQDDRPSGPRDHSPVCEFRLPKMISRGQKRNPGSF